MDLGSEALESQDIHWACQKWSFLQRNSQSQGSEKLYTDVIQVTFWNYKSRGGCHCCVLGSCWNDLVDYMLAGHVLEIVKSATIGFSMYLKVSFKNLCLTVRCFDTLLERQTVQC